MRHEIPVRCFSIALYVLRPVQTGYQVLLLRRNGHTQPGQWCQIAGGIEAGETAWQTARREAEEETGLQLTDLYSADRCEQFYEADNNGLTLVPVFVAYVAADADIVLNAEHSEFHWATFEEAARMLPFPGQRDILHHIHRYFAEQQPHPLLRMPLGA
ncbi:MULTISPECIES: NUDIX pyrophosphatase [unclassified Symbiopectobacterium]|uniref:NUDIX hydrolase n=1 Tax=unclassified Symbiopectobacterium TaxID=2794573 RepID=UPI0022266ABE|nr:MULTISPECIES: NUDIX domain-containing protein [unclassified Symbiopectobacterium]MCW2474809.1 NUDIX domain-containing protein [Candidatus Symbiopectobacterium sp. NZEC151]MCW2487463.1 NUDIX domain-containing protein [Candidatus Symbiopectobacterium sp. NZEC127]